MCGAWGRADNGKLSLNEWGGQGGGAEGEEPMWCSVTGSGSRVGYRPIMQELQILDNKHIMYFSKYKVIFKH